MQKWKRPAVKLSFYFSHFKNKNVGIQFSLNNKAHTTNKQKISSK